MSESLEIEDLVNQLFSSLPREPKSCQIIPDFGNDQVDNELIFEMLMNIYMDSIIDAERLADMIIANEPIEKKNIDSIDLSRINKDVLELVNPWFKSFGFNVNVHEYDEQTFKEMKSFLNIYSRVIFRDYDTGYFIMNNISNIYHFVKNGSYKNSDNIKDICFTINYNDKNYVISFSPF
jgi:hypothetical protein